MNAALRASENEVRPRLACGYELLGTGLAAALSLASFGLSGTTAATALNVLGPVILGLSLSYGILRTVAVHRLAIWFPSLWFRITVIPLYVVGGLSPYLVDARASAYLQVFARLDPATVAKVNVAIMGGLLLVVMCFFVTRVRRPSEESIRASFESADTAPLMSAFLVVGALIRYGVEIPQALHLAELQWLRPIVPFAFLFQMGFLLLVMRALLRGGSLVWIAAAIFVVDTAVSSLSMMKLQIIANLVLVFTAALTVRCSVPRFIIGSIVLVCAFIAITGVMDNARVIAASVYQPGQQTELWGSPTARLGAIAEAIVGDGDHRQFDRVQSLLVRLCYTPLIAATMAFGDRGVAFLGADFWTWSWVPRLIYPAKPTIDFGGQFYTLLSGKTLTWMSPTFFGDAYWHASWAGVYVWMLAYGVVLALWTRFTSFIVGSGWMLFIPVAFMGFRFAGAHYGFLVSHFTAFISQALYLAFGLWLIQVIYDRLIAMGFSLPAIHPADTKHTLEKQ